MINCVFIIVFFSEKPHVQIVDTIAWDDRVVPIRLWQEHIDLRLLQVGILAQDVPHGAGAQGVDLSIAQGSWNILFCKIGKKSSLSFSRNSLGRPLLVKKNLSPCLMFLNCLPMMQLKVGPTRPPLIGSSARPAVNRSMSPVAVTVFKNFRAAVRCLLCI